MSSAGGLAFRPDEEHARELDAADPLAALRGKFLVPPGPDGGDAAYLCGNSLGLQPAGAAERVRRELEDWARLGVAGHFEARSPWYRYHESFREPLARLTGALPHEVVAMGGLTGNLHLMLVSFYRPSASRWRIVMEEGAFPSDRFAVRSHLRWHGLDPDEGVLVAGAGADADEDAERRIAEHAGEIALVLLGSVQYFTGRRFDVARITAAGRRAGAAVGWDLAHAIGNVPLRLHDDGPDFAVWCSYKYLNAGPGAVAGCFVHERHAERPDLVRLAGWWGNDPDTRFRMQAEREFVPVRGADGWQLGNPPVLALAPLAASLALFDEAGMEALRRKSLGLTGYLERWVEHAGSGRVEILTPRDPERRGCQLSLRVQGGLPELLAGLARSGVVVDHRDPDVIRAAPVPLYNRYHDVWRFGRALAAWSGADGRRAR